jgi:hypothetical protein
VVIVKVPAVAAIQIDEVGVTYAAADYLVIVMALKTQAGINFGGTAAPFEREVHIAAQSVPIYIVVQVCVIGPVLTVNVALARIMAGKTVNLRSVTGVIETIVHGIGSVVVTNYVGSRGT